MNIDYQLNKASAAFNEIYFDSPHIENFFVGPLLEACVVLNTGIRIWFIFHVFP